jgi:hemerythrin
MSPQQEHSVEKIHRDHDYLLELATRIKGLCTQRGLVESCRTCDPTHRTVCQGNVEQMILTFVESSLKHQLVESVYMHNAPAEHRIAHARAHLAIAEQLKTIRVVFAEDGNSMLAIEGIDAALATLREHIVEYDEPLEEYLRAAA